MQAIYPEHIEPIKGAAEYYAGYDKENGKAVVFMKDTSGYCSVIQTYKGIVQAKIAANRWQIKENKSVSRLNS